jgi:hypothetical protein
MRGVSAAILFAGIVILVGTNIPKLTLPSFVDAILIFIGYAIGRKHNMHLDIWMESQIY